MPDPAKRNWIKPVLIVGVGVATIILLKLLGVTDYLS